jgi:metal-dependent hydrolase (beta-lactamase superfamily II)
MKATIEAFREMGIERILLGHCTGVNSYARLAAAFCQALCLAPDRGADPLRREVGRALY